MIDFDGLRLHPPEVVHDLPAGGRRLVQRVDGYAATLVAGTPVFEHGQHTGATTRPAGAARWRSRHPQPRLSGTSAIFRSVAGRKGCPAPLFPLLSARNLQPAIHPRRAEAVAGAHSKEDHAMRVWQFWRCYTSHGRRPTSPPSSVPICHARRDALIYRHIPHC